MIKIYKISIIVPVYNAKDTLKIAINSVINQTFKFKDIELILIDDDSTDSSKEIIKNYSRRYDNINGIFLSKNSGLPSKPRNIGIENCSGKYIMFLDSDDELPKDSCEIFYSTIEKYNCDIVSGQVYNKFIDGLYTSLSKISLKQVIIDNPSILRSNVWGNIFKTKFIKDNNIKFPLYLPEDGIFAVNAYGKAKKIIWMPEYPGYIYTVEMESKLSYTHNIKQQTIIDSINGHYVYKNHVIKYGFDEEVILNNSISFLLLMFLKVNGSKKEKKYILNELYTFEKTLNFKPKLKSLPLNILNNFILNKMYFIVIFISVFANFLYNNRTIKNLIFRRYSNLRKVEIR